MTTIPIFRSSNASNGVSTGSRIDSNEMMFFTNELTNYDPKEFEVLKAPLTSFNIFSQKQIEKYTTVYTYSMFEGFGTAKYAAMQTGKADDIPFVGAGGKQYSTPIQDVLCALAFSDADILANQVVRRDIISSLMRQAMRANYERMNKTCFFGYKDLGLPGLIDNALLPTISGLTANNLATVTDATILINELNSIVKKVADNSTSLIAPDTLLVSPKIYNNLNMVFWSTFTGATVKTAFENLNNIKIYKAQELSAANNGKGKEIAILFKNDPDFAQHIMAEPFAVKPPQAQGLEYISYCYSRHGGLVIRQPNAFCIYTNYN